MPGANRRRIGCGIVTNKLVPSRIRRTLNVESGLNDGIVAPLVSLAVAILVGESTGTHTPLVHAIREIGVGALVGVGVGLAAGWVLALAVRKGWAESGTCRLVTPAAAIGTYALRCHTPWQRLRRRLLGRHVLRNLPPPPRRAVARTHRRLGSASCLRGLVCLRRRHAPAEPLKPRLRTLPAVRSAELDNRQTLPGLPSRLYRTHLGKATVGFIGWFGPRGLASAILPCSLLTSWVNGPTLYSTWYRSPSRSASSSTASARIP